MAIATTTALAIGGLAISAASTTASFIQAGKQREAQRNAERDAASAMDAARKKLDTNFYDKLSIQKEPYQLQREALLSQGAQAIQAGVESERGVAATAGRIQMAQNEAQAGISTAMGQELSNLEKLSAQEDSRLRDANLNLDLQTVEGAQKAAANAASLGAQATQQGFQGLTSLGKQALDFVPLYGKIQSAKEFQGLQNDYASAIQNNKLGSKFMDATGKPLPFQQAILLMGVNQGGVGLGFDTSGIGAMKTNEFQDYMTQQNAKNIQDIRATGFGAKTPNLIDYMPQQNVKNIQAIKASGFGK